MSPYLARLINGGVGEEGMGVYRHQFYTLAVL